MIEMDPRECAVDFKTYILIQEILGHEVSDKLLYEGNPAYKVGEHVRLSS